MPWRHFTGWGEQWASQPSFLVGEYLFIAVAVVALLHARACGKNHVLAWVAALVAGTANDCFFMVLPLVDNFWQAQATIMITPRLPLYIPCVYVCFLYIPRVATWRLGLPRLAGAAAAGLAAILFYEPYDIVGARFLWWTWHDTDLPIAARIVGSPIGSIMFVMLFAAAYGWVLDRAIAGAAVVTRRRFAGALALVAVASTPLMMLAMAPLQQLDGGLPGPIGLAAEIAILLGLALHGARRRGAATRYPAPDRKLWLAVSLHFSVLAGIAILFDPARVVATGIHQTLGPCDVLATDIAGHVRHEYLCAHDYAEEFTLACAPPPSEPAQWYTVCGTPHTQRGTWLAVILALSITGAIAFTRMLKGRRSARP